MDNGEGSASASHEAESTDTHKQVWNEAATESLANIAPPAYLPSDGDSYKEVLPNAGARLEAPQTAMMNSSARDDTSKEVYSIFSDQRNYAEDMPLEEVIRLLQAAEGEEQVPISPVNSAEALVSSSNGHQIPTAAPWRPDQNYQWPSNTNNPETFRAHAETTSMNIPDSSIVSDNRNYLDGDISMQELSIILEAAESENQEGRGNIEEDRPHFTTSSVRPDTDPLNVGSVSIIRDFRNYVGDVALPDIAGVLGAADEADIEAHEYSNLREISPSTEKLCDCCSRINLAYGTSHFNLAVLKMSAESGCPCCQLIHKAMDGIIQHPRLAKYSKLNPESSSEGEAADDEGYERGGRSGGSLSKISVLNKLPHSTIWARQSNIEVELARNALIYKVFDCYYKDGRRYNGNDIVKFFEFCEMRDDPLPGYKSIFGRVLESDPGSEASFALIFEWLETCDNEHVKCKKNHRTQLPKRVIDVWEENPVLVESHGKHAPYILLSHCWGGKQIIQTTQATLLERTQGIPFDDLPKTFQDAVTIARTLGIQYLWIDSLCIVQDLEEDWITESGSMKEYYRNGYLTISALYSPNSYHGILNIREDLSVVQLSPNTNLYLRPRLPDYREIFRDAPLNNRAWALQERLLSTRILHYTDKEILWECQTCSTRESSVLVSTVKTDPDTVLTSEGEDFKRVLFHLDGDPYSVIDGAFVTWYRLVTNFSRRAITFNSDRLPAISGLASLIESKIGATYLAGIWKEDVRSLVWFRDTSRSKYETGEVTNSSATETPFPSWSWASASGPIRYRYEEILPSGFEASILNYGLPNFSTSNTSEGFSHSIVLRARSQPFVYDLGSLHGNKLTLFEDNDETIQWLVAAEGCMDFTESDTWRHDTRRIPGSPMWRWNGREQVPSPSLWGTCRALWIIEQRGEPYQTFEHRGDDGIGRLGEEKIEYLTDLMFLLVQRVPSTSGDFEGSKIWRRIGVGIMKGGVPDQPTDNKWSEMKDFEII